MKRTLSSFVSIFKDAVTGTLDHGHITSAAAIAFYTIFSLPGLLISIVIIAGLFVGQDAVTGELSNQIDGFIGSSAAATVENIIVNINIKGKGTLETLIGLGTLIFSATTVFVTLQAALNATWEIKTSNKSGWLSFLFERVVSFGMIVSLGFIFVVSLIADTFLKLLMDRFNLIIGSTSANLVEVLSFILTSMTVLALFIAIYTVLPEIKLGWRKVFQGAFITFLLFMLGKVLIGIYLKQTDFSKTYESAGSMILILVWVYYTTIILLFGSEVTRAIISNGKGNAPQLET